MKIIRQFLSFLYLIWGLVVFTGLMIIVLPFVLLCSALMAGRKAQNANFLFLRLWAQAVSILCLYPVRVIRQPEPGNAYIYVSNHNSYLDAVMVVLAIPGSFKPLGKIEMLKVPVFGMIYKRVVVLIDRENKESRAQSIQELKAGLAQGESILIFPEGKMNRTDEPLADFYDGAFRLSIETNTPVMPMVILNARNLLPREKPLDARPGLVTCVFGKAILPAEGMTAEELKVRVRSAMRALMEEEGRD